MTTTTLYVIIALALLIGIIIVAVATHKELNNPNNIDLLQGKLENSNASITDAMDYLEITNKGNL